MKINQKAVLGSLGEELAAKFLLANKYKIIKKNFYSRRGEIDIIAIYDNTIIFVEVKLRSSSIENAVSSVSQSKQKKLIKTAQDFIAIHPEYENYATRFDIITLIKKGDQYKLNHFPDAFLTRSRWEVI